MSVLEIGFVIPDTPEELFAFIGDPSEEPQPPFSLVLCKARWTGAREVLQKAPIGLYRLPTFVGDHVECDWPANFHGPFSVSARDVYELRLPDDRVPCDGRIGTSYALAKGDVLQCTLTVTGIAA